MEIKPEKHVITNSRDVERCKDNQIKTDCDFMGWADKTIEK